jgi:hypothetical protein
MLVMVGVGAVTVKVTGIVIGAPGSVVLSTRMLAV